LREERRSRLGGDGLAPGHPAAGQADSDATAAAVGELHQQTAVSLIRLAHVILGDREAAEDVVQEAFCSLFRGWHQLADSGRAQYYLRTSVLNGCRSALRKRRVRSRRVLYELPAASAEAAALSSQEQADVIRAVDRLPQRQREALVLRYYLDLPDEEIAQVMGVRPGTVRSTMHRALNAVGEMLRQGS
jgi:RNA polymerase sigma-70 factor (sigma-E family)